MDASSPSVPQPSSSTKPAPIRSRRPSSSLPARRFATRAPRQSTRFGKSHACGGVRQMSVVYVLWLREVKKYLRSRVQIIASLGSPLMYLAVLAFLVVALIAVIFSALATAIGSSIKEMQGFQMVMNFFVMPLFFLSGAIYPLEGLPRVLGALTRVDPLTYGVDGMRGLLTGRTHFGVALDIGVLLGVGVLFVIFGAWRFSKIEA